MNTMDAFLLGQAAQAAGKPIMVFDWDKAALLINQLKPNYVAAGLAGDWEYTGGTIYREGIGPVTDFHTYLSSNWATPEIEIDGVKQDCWVYMDDCEWDSDTKWPKSALDILNAPNNS